MDIFVCNVGLPFSIVIVVETIVYSYEMREKKTLQCKKNK